MLSHLFEVEAILHILDATAKTPEDEMEDMCNSFAKAVLECSKRCMGLPFCLVVLPTERLQRPLKLTPCGQGTVVDEHPPND